MKKIIMITGAASGIGYQLAKKFLLKGHKVFMTDCNEVALDEALNKIKGVLLETNCPGTPIGAVLNVCSLADIETVKQYVEDCGRLDVLINNAGIACNKEMAETSNVEWFNLINVNLFGPIRLINEFLPMLKKSNGHIVNVSSGQAFFRLPGWGAYSATKVALSAVSELLAFELSKYNIKVTTVYPFMVDTPFYKNVTGDTFVSKMAMKLIPYYSNTPEYVANKIFEAVQDYKRVEYVNPINYLGVAVRALPPIAAIFTYIANKLFTRS
jgi:NAD(P)-dependent dehydrogenase (short-subunit alcohol dehydrogenase family)